MYLLRTRDEAKRHETSQNGRNHAKRRKTRRKDPTKLLKRPKTTPNFKIGEIQSFLLAFVFQTLCPNAQFWVFGVKTYQRSNLLTKFSLSFILKVLILNLKISLKIRAHMSTFGHFRSKSINFIILAKFCTYLIPNVLISNLTFVFENFETESRNMGIQGQKYQLSILIKFCLYSISKVLVSNLTQSGNLRAAMVYVIEDFFAIARLHRLHKHFSYQKVQYIVCAI